MKVVYFAANFMNIISVQSLDHPSLLSLPYHASNLWSTGGREFLLPKESGLCGVSWKAQQRLFLSSFRRNGGKYISRCCYNAQ